MHFNLNTENRTERLHLDTNVLNRPGQNRAATLVLGDL